MKLRLTVGLLLGWLLFSCHDDDEEPAFPLSEGTYTGIFHRSSPNARWRASQVRLVLKDHRFSGSTDIQYYPAIGEGTFVLIGPHAIRFSNERFWTANFDWTFILDGSYQIRQEGEELIIHKDYGGGVFDMYKLRREGE